MNRPTNKRLTRTTFKYKSVAVCDDSSSDGTVADAPVSSCSTAPPIDPVVWNSDNERDEDEISTQSGRLAASWSSSSDEAMDTGESSSSEDEVEDEDEVDMEGELDYVSVHNTSVSSTDSNEPLSTHVQRLWERNQPGSTNFQWKDEENVPRVYGFSGNPGVCDPDLSGDSSVLDCFRAFITRSIMSHVVTQTNR